MKKRLTYIFTLMFASFLFSVQGQSNVESTVDSVELLFFKKEYRQVLKHGWQFIKEDYNCSIHELSCIKLLSLVGKSYYHLNQYDSCIIYLKLILEDESLIFSNDFEKSNRDYIVKSNQALEFGTHPAQKESVTKYFAEKTHELTIELKQEKKHTSLKSELIRKKEKTIKNLFWLIPVTIVFVFSIILVLLKKIRKKETEKLDSEKKYQSLKKNKISEVRIGKFLEGFVEPIKVYKRLRIRAKNIRYVKTTPESASKKIDIFYTENEKKVVTIKMALKEFYKTLPQDHFVRVNGSLVINLALEYTCDTGRIKFEDKDEPLSFEKEFESKEKTYNQLKIHSHLQNFSPKNTQ